MKKWEIELREKTLARFYGYGYNFIQEVGIYIVYGWLLLYSKKGTKKYASPLKRGQKSSAYICLTSTLLLWLPKEEM